MMSMFQHCRVALHRLPALLAAPIMCRDLTIRARTAVMPTTPHGAAGAVPRAMVFVLALPALRLVPGRSRDGSGGLRLARVPA